MKSLILMLFLPAAFAAEPKLEELKLPPGYKISVYAHPVKNARSLTLGSDGTVYVGTRSEGNVYALLPDKNGDGRSDETVTIAKGLNMPNGVAFKDGALYIAEVSQVSVIKDITKNLRSAKLEKFGAKFPHDEHHGWKFIAFGPDGWLYVPVGAPCNICNKNENLYAAIHKVSPDGKKRELVAKGVRNTVGFDWQPGTNDFWFTENGRDWMGDEQPPCELNRLEKAGAHYGYPFCHGTNVLDPEFGKGKSCKDYVAPKFEFTAHAAPLGMRFMKNEKLKNSVLVAEHGSWNRSELVGYQVTKIEVNGKNAGKAEPFITGFKNGKSVWGRPVDVLELPDGSILVSDDVANAVYRVTR